MKWTRSELEQYSSLVEFEEDVTIDDDAFQKNSRINRVCDVHVEGSGYLNEEEDSFFLSMDIDATPTIAPVMDLTNIDSGIKEINSLADRTNLLFGSATVANVKGVSSISSNPVQTSIDGLRGDIGSLNSTLRSSMHGENMNLLNDMVALMNQYFPEFASRQVILDSGQMVGAMTPRINKELRNIYNRSR